MIRLGDRKYNAQVSGLCNQCTEVNFVKDQDSWEEVEEWKVFPLLSPCTFFGFKGKTARTQWLDL